MTLPLPGEPDFVVATLMRDEGGSGVQSHVRDVYYYLHSRSQNVSVVSPFSSRSLLLRPAFALRYGIHPFSHPGSVWWYRHWHAHFLEQALATRLAAAKDQAVVYAQCPVSANVALRVRSDQPVVMAAHFNVSQADEWAEKGLISRQSALFRSIRSFEEDVLPQLDGVVYVSSHTRTLLEQRIPALSGIPGVVIPNFVAPAQVGNRQPVADLITVGSLEPRKNQGYLLHVLRAAAARGHRYTLSIVGDGPDRRELESQTRRLGLGDQVRFLGYRNDARSLMRGHRIYCHTSRMESFGIALVEAMVEGLPVLAAAVGGVPEIVRPGRDGQFWPLDDPESAGEVLIELMQDPRKRQLMGQAGRLRATTEFSSEVLGLRLLNFLRDSQTRRLPGV